MDKHATRLLRHLKRIVAQQESNQSSPVNGKEQRLNDAVSTSPKDSLLSETQRSALIPAPTAFPTLAAAIAAAASGTTSSRSKDPSQRAMMPPPSSRPSKSPRPSATTVSRRAAAAAASSSRSATLDARNAVAFPALRGSDSSVPQQCSSTGVSSRESSDSAQDSSRNDDPNASAMHNGEATPAGAAGERSGRRSTPQSGTASNAASDRAALSKARPPSKKRPRAPIPLEIPPSGSCDNPVPIALYVSPRSLRQERGVSVSPRSRNRGSSGSEPAVRQPPAVQLLEYLQSLLVARPKSQEQQKEQQEQLAALNALTMDLLVENVVLAMTNSGCGGGNASGAVAAATDEKLSGCGDGSNPPVAPPPADAAWTDLGVPPANEAASGGNAFVKDDAWNAAVTAGDNSLDSSTASASAAVAVILLAASAVSSSAVAEAPHSTVSPAASAARQLPPSAAVPPLVLPLSTSANESPSAPSMFPRLESIAEAPSPVETSDERVTAVEQTADAACKNDPSAAEGCEVSLSEVPGVSWDELLKSMQDQSGDVIASSGSGIDSHIPSLDDEVHVDKEAREPALERSASGGGTDSADMKQMQELLADLLQSPDLLQASAPAGGLGYDCDGAYGISFDPTTAAADTTDIACQPPHRSQFETELGHSERSSPSAPVSDAFDDFDSVTEVGVARLAEPAIGERALGEPERATTASQNGLSSAEDADDGEVPPNSTAAAAASVGGAAGGDAIVDRAPEGYARSQHAENDDGAASQRGVNDRRDEAKGGAELGEETQRNWDDHGPGQAAEEVKRDEGVKGNDGEEFGENKDAATELCETGSAARGSEGSEGAALKIETEENGSRRQAVSELKTDDPATDAALTTDLAENAPLKDDSIADGVDATSDKSILGLSDGPVPGDAVTYLLIEDDSLEDDSFADDDFPEDDPIVDDSLLNKFYPIQGVLPSSDSAELASSAEAAIAALQSPSFPFPFPTAALPTEARLLLSLLAQDALDREQYRRWRERLRVAQWEWRNEHERRKLAVREAMEWEARSHERAQEDDEQRIRRARMAARAVASGAAAYGEGSRVSFASFALSPAAVQQPAHFSPTSPFPHSPLPPASPRSPLLSPSPDPPPSRKPRAPPFPPPAPEPRLWYDECFDPAYPPHLFHHHFRMSPGTFDHLFSSLLPIEGVRLPSSAPKIPLRMRLAVCLWRLASAEPLYLVSRRFGLSGAMCSRIHHETCATICQALIRTHIHMPSSPAERAAAAGKFEEVCGLPGGCVAALHTTQIAMNTPRTGESMREYENRRLSARRQKVVHSVAVQVAVGADGLILDVSAGPGSLTDRDVLLQSQLYQRRGERYDVAWEEGVGNEEEEDADEAAKSAAEVAEEEEVRRASKRARMGGDRGGGHAEAALGPGERSRLRVVEEMGRRKCG
ncbi:unnamed protein product [Closterium sp. Yama58-4]|nr:unnamed protein product [Closterium sp. Yama58-4]